MIGFSFRASIFLSFEKRKVPSANYLTLSHPIASLISLIWYNRNNKGPKTYSNGGWVSTDDEGTLFKPCSLSICPGLFIICSSKLPPIFYLGWKLLCNRILFPWRFNAQSEIVVWSLQHGNLAINILLKLSFSCAMRRELLIHMLSTLGVRIISSMKNSG